ncbi:MAG: F0F1 ATP synthase subunit B [Acidimicrobiales bacterium]
MHVALILAQAAEGGHAEETVNPILPAANELIWGALSFVVLLLIMKKYAFPALTKAMDARAEKIKASLDEAEKAKDEAQEVLADYKRQLADAKNEAARIIEEARQTADKIRQDLHKQAEAEAAEIKRRANDDIQAQAARTMADLRAQVSLLAIQLAEKVVEQNLDGDTNRALVERFIDQMGSNS